MNDNLIFSIIIVSLNTKIEFLETLRSVHNQDFKNFEVIIVDGGSSDGTQEEIINNEKLINKKIIEKDQGIYDAMNKGIELSDGEWVIFMNSGDIFFDKKILSSFIINNYSNYDVVYGNTKIKNNGFEHLSISKFFNKKTFIMPFNHQSSFVKTKIIKERKFSLNYKFSSDFDFFYHCFSKNKKFKKINKIISIVKSGGMSDKNRQKVYSENINILKSYNSLRYIYSIYMLKYFQYVKDIIKSILPSKIINLILKAKYKQYD